MLASILVSSFNRLNLFKRTLWALNKRPPTCEFELVVADEGSNEEILKELQKYNFHWKFVSVDIKKFEEKTGIKKFWNCPSLTNNVAFNYSSGKYVFQMGNEIIPWGIVFDGLMKEIPKTKYAWCVSTTYDMPQKVLNELDEYGTNFGDTYIHRCLPWKLSNSNNVPNYLSVFTREVWTELNGYDERYIGGIGAEDSDFMRRAASLPTHYWRSCLLSFHQNHGGVSHFQRPSPEIIAEERFAVGVKKNREIYNSWKNEIKNGQGWEPGSNEFVKEIIENVRN